MAAVDQPTDGVDGREVDKGVVVPLPIMAWSTATTLSLLLAKQQQRLNKKRDKNNDHLQYIQTLEGTKFPKGLTLVQTKEYTNIYSAW